MQLTAITLILIRILTFITALTFISHNFSIIINIELFKIRSSSLEISIIFDPQRLIFISTVTLISSTIIWYRIEYISHEIPLDRFNKTLLLFIFSIIIVILSPNLLFILLGWDGLGLVSYCLVIYYQNYRSFNAGIITALSNRLGDVALLISIGWIISYGTWNFILISPTTNLNFITIMILIAAITKSAQIPFRAWLPAAIAAPTPVRALVHSSTLVTAGIYLLIRFFHLFNNQIITNFILLIGTLTIIIAGISALFEYDLKKIIALSTLRQLGLIIFVLGLNIPILAFFHLITHATFKALLFICAGLIIHISANNQDIRTIGIISNQNPIISSILNIANLALCGLPFLAGFYSKDLIIEISFSLNFNSIIFFLSLIRISLTCFYSLRLSYFSLVINLNSNTFNFINYHIPNMTHPIIIIASIAIISGTIIQWILLQEPIIPIIHNRFKLLIPIISIIRILLILVKTIHPNSIIQLNFLSNIWLLPQISSQITIIYPLKTSIIIQSWNDLTWNEIIPTKISWLINLNLSTTIKSLNISILTLITSITLVIILIPIYYSYSLNIKALLWRSKNEISKNTLRAKTKELQILTTHIRACP